MDKVLARLVRAISEGQNAARAWWTNVLASLARAGPVSDPTSASFMVARERAWHRVGDDPYLGKITEFACGNTYTMRETRVWRMPIVRDEEAVHMATLAPGAGSIAVYSAVVENPDENGDTVLYRATIILTRTLHAERDATNTGAFTVTWAEPTLTRVSVVRVEEESTAWTDFDIDGFFAENVLAVRTVFSDAWRECQGFGKSVHFDEAAIEADYLCQALFAQTRDARQATPGVYITELDGRDAWGRCIGIATDTRREYLVMTAGDALIFDVTFDEGVAVTATYRRFPSGSTVDVTKRVCEELASHASLKGSEAAQWAKINNPSQNGTYLFVDELGTELSVGGTDSELERQMHTAADVISQLEDAHRLATTVFADNLARE
jgi:hypothetical protein